MSGFSHRNLDVYKRRSRCSRVLLRQFKAFEAGDGLQLTKIYTRPNIQLVDDADGELVRVSEMLTKLAIRWEEDGIRKLAQKRKRKSTCTCPCTCS